MTRRPYGRLFLRETMFSLNAEASWRIIKKERKKPDDAKYYGREKNKRLALVLKRFCFKRISHQIADFIVSWLKHRLTH